MMRAEFDRRRRVMVEGLNAVPGMSCRMPAGAFYAFPNTGALYGKSAEGRTVRNSSDLALYLLESAGVALVPGSAFGDDGFIRLSYATSEANIRKGLQRMGEAVSKLK
jgi:aspartate aminotransferase